MAQKIIQMQMRHLFSNRKGFVILTSLLRFENKSREFRDRFGLVMVWYDLLVKATVRLLRTDQVYRPYSAIFGATLNVVTGHLKIEALIV